MKALALVICVVVVGLGVLWATRGGERGSTRSLAETPAAVEEDVTRPEPAVAAAPTGPIVLTVGARILDGDGRPIPGARLLRGVNDGRSLRVLREASADASGAARLAFTEYEVQPHQALVLAAAAPGHVRLQRTVDASVPAAVIDLGDWVLAPGGDITGRVVDARGAAVAGARVVLSEDLGEASEEERARARLWPHVRELGMPEVVPVTTTDGGGYFGLVGMPVGRFDVVAWRLVLDVPLVVPLRPGRLEGLLVEAGRTSDAGELTLADALPEELVRGIVLDSQGQPLDSAVVRVLDVDAALPALAQTSAAGRFAIPAPPGVDLRVHARDFDGDAFAEVSGARAGGPEVVLRVESSAPAPADPEAPRSVPSGPARLSGRFTLGGEPAHGWRAQKGGPLDHEGAFVLEGLGSGDFDLALLKRGGGTLWRAYMERVPLAPGNNDWSRDLAVGTLVLENLPRAEPAPDVPETDWPEYVLEWKDGSTTWVVHFQESADGRVELEDVPARRLELRYRGPGVDRSDHYTWPVAGAVEVVAGERRTVRLP